LKLSIIAETAITVPKETVDLAWMSFFGQTFQLNWQGRKI